MRMRFLSGLAIGTVLVGCGLVLSAAPAAVSQDPAKSFPAAPAPSLARPTPLDSSTDRQMRSFRRHAQVNMILYTGSFGPGERAAAQDRLDAIALTLPTRSR